VRLHLTSRLDRPGDASVQVDPACRAQVIEQRRTDDLVAEAKEVRRVPLDQILAACLGKEVEDACRATAAHSRKQLRREAAPDNRRDLDQVARRWAQSLDLCA
jgi:hypothetical protein